MNAQVIAHFPESPGSVDTTSWVYVALMDQALVALTMQIIICGPAIHYINRMLAEDHNEDNDRNMLWMQHRHVHAAYLMLSMSTFRRSVRLSTSLSSEH